MKIVDKVVHFFNGLNTDTAKDFIKEGQSDYRLNCDISDISTQGQIVNSDGNILISPNFTWPEGDNKCVGQFSQEDFIIYFIHNSNNNDCIIKYQGGNFYRLIWRKDLGLLGSVRISGIVNDVLYWADPIPRNLNITKAINYTETILGNATSASCKLTKEEDNTLVCQSYISVQKGDKVYIKTGTNLDRFYVVQDVINNGFILYYPFNINPINGTVYVPDGDSYVHINEEELSLIKQPPLRRPFAFSYYDSGAGNSNLIGNLFKFSYRWIYKDLSQCRPSSISQLTIPEFNLNVDSVNVSPLADNAIQVSVDRGSDEVGYIEIYFQVNNEDWKLIDRFERGLGYDLMHIQFYNNFNYAVVLTNDIQTGFDNIPVKANDINIISNTYLELSGNQMFEQDKVELNASVQKFNPINAVSKFNISPQPPTVLVNLNTKVTYYGDNYSSQITGTIDWSFVQGLTNNKIFGFSITLGRKTCVKCFYTTSTNDPTLIQSALISEFGDFGIIDNNGNFQFNKTLNSNNFSPIQLSIYVFNKYYTASSIELPQETLDGSGQLGIVYYDKYKRNVGIQTNDNLKLAFTDSLNNTIPNGILPNGVYVNINHTPPKQAISYQLFYTGNYNYSLNIPTPIDYVSSDDKGTYLKTENASATINNDQISTVYSFEEGDYVSIYAKNISLLVKITPIILKIVGQLDVNDLTKIYVSGSINSFPSTTGGYMSNIIRLSNGSNSIFYECSPVFDIVNGFHVGNVKTQTNSSPAAVVVTKGDMFNRKQSFKIEDIGSLFSVYVAHNGRSSVVYAVGESGLIMVQSSATWTSKTSGVNVNLNSINKYGTYICGDDGIVIDVSANKFNTGVTNRLNSICINGSTTQVFYGAVIGDNGIILKPVTTGSSGSYSLNKFTSLTSPTTKNLYSVDFFDSTHGVAVGRDGTIIKTTNGSTWSLVTNSYPVDLYGVVMLSQTISLAVGKGGVILKTTDGITWNTISSGVTIDLKSVSDSGYSYMVAVGYGGTVLTSVDSGSTWHSLSSSVSNKLYGVGVSVVPSHTGFAFSYIVGQNGIILGTSKDDFGTESIFTSRKASETNTVVISTNTFSESSFYKSNYWGNGRINVPIKQVGGGFLNNNLLSGKYVPNTQQNGLCTFDWQESSNEANDKYGQIYKSIVVGDIFNIIQRDKISSYYIGHEVGRSKTGDIVIAIDAILGNIRELEGKFGTVHPDSVCSKDNYVYGFDLNRKCIWRKAENGVIDLSSTYEVSYFIEQISNLILNNLSRYNVVSFVNNYTSMVYFTFIDSLNEHSATIGFFETNEENKQFVSFYSWIPEMYAGISNIYCFKGGNLYLHSKSGKKCTYFGVKYPQVIKAVHNDDQVKIFDSFAIDSNERWDISAVIDPNDTYRNGMYTEIKAAQLKSEKGWFYHEFLRNMKTRQGSNSKMQLYSGDKMRGTVLEMILTNTKDTEVILNSVTIKARID